MASKKVSVSMRTAGVDESPLPDSRNFADPGADQDPLKGLHGLHVHGTPVEDLPPEMIPHLSYPMTDEGLEQQQRINRQRSMRTPLGRQAADPVQKAMVERGDFLSKQSNEPWMAPDGRKDLVEQHIEPGMRGKFLSPEVIRKRGMRGFEPVLDEHGDVVKSGDSILGQMPAENAAKRNEYYRRMSDDKVGQVYAKADDSEAARKSDPEALAAGAPRQGEQATGNEFFDGN